MEKGIGSEPAGLDIHGQQGEEDVEKYDLYKTFEIEFENSPSTSLVPSHFLVTNTNKRARRSRQLCPKMERSPSPTATRTPAIRTNTRRDDEHGWFTRATSQGVVLVM